MTIRDLLIFTAVGTAAILGITIAGYYYFRRWYIEEKTNGQRQIETRRAELLREKARQAQSNQAASSD